MIPSIFLYTVFGHNAAVGKGRGKRRPKCVGGEKKGPTLRVNEMGVCFCIGDILMHLGSHARVCFPVVLYAPVRRWLNVHMMV